MHTGARTSDARMLPGEWGDGSGSSAVAGWGWAWPGAPCG